MYGRWPGSRWSIVPVYVIGIVYYAGSPQTTDVGYSPTQPVPYSHALHAGELGIDCRYCHTTVEEAAFAGRPAHLGLHELSHADRRRQPQARGGPRERGQRQSGALGPGPRPARTTPISTTVPTSPRCVGCVSCHGRVDRMEQVTQVERLSMGWCLECHRNPEPNLRPQEFITKMDWTPNEPLEMLGARLRKQNNLNPSTDCSTCHR